MNIEKINAPVAPIIPPKIIAVPRLCIYGRRIGIIIGAEAAPNPLPATTKAKFEAVALIFVGYSSPNHTPK